MTPDDSAPMAHEIDAFVNGQLDAERRFAVASYLAAHPDRAAEVMAALRLTEGLRLALDAVATPAPAALQHAARRLDRGLRWRQQRRAWMPFAAAAAMFVLGWTAQSMTPIPPVAPQGPGLAGIIDAALDAQDAVAVHLSLTPVTGPVPVNTAEISARLGIALPVFPQGWTVSAAQVVATPERPGLAVVIDTPDLGEIMLFSVLRDPGRPSNGVLTALQDGRALAVFEDDRTAFVLVDRSGPLGDLRRGAEQLRLALN